MSVFFLLKVAPRLCNSLPLSISFFTSVSMFKSSDSIVFWMDACKVLFFLGLIHKVCLC